MAKETLTDREEFLDSTVDVPHLSYSQVDKYLTCPEKYRLYYIENLRPKVAKASLIFGATMHVALAELFKVGQHPVATFAKLWDDLETEELNYSARESWQGFKGKGAALLEKFVEEELVKLSDITGIEKVFEVNVSTVGRPFIGVIDLVAVMDGKKTVIDFKTASSAYEPYEVVLSDQLTAYSLAEPDAEQVAFCLFIKTKGPRIEWHVAQRDDKRLVEYLSKVTLVSEEIDAGKFYKRPGKHCGWCEFLPVCLGDKKRIKDTLIKLEGGNTS
jgi:CRISPR/Cas system-associated exonuclease Cas4 (RecB family)